MTLRHVCAVVVGCFGMTGVWAADLVVGEFEGESKDKTKAMMVELTKDGDSYRLSGGAAYVDGSSAAPDFEGELIEEKGGVARFTFKDSFDNEGELTLTKEGKGYQVDIDISKLEDSRCLAVYGVTRLEPVKGK